MHAVFIKKRMILLLIAVSVLLLATCKEDISGAKNENQPPNTSLFIETENTLNATSSVRTFYWDGQDPDGFITGFYYAFGNNPAPNEWTWTTLRTMTFPLQITGQDTTYIFNIKAVDNEGIEDPTPARQAFPIKNSPPQISWQLNSNIPDTTFTVASFLWTAEDLDGDTTIKSFEYALDDTSSWVEISGTKRSITLHEDEGITEGDHAFYIRAIDVAGSKSPFIRMPELPGKMWHVKKPKGIYLLIDDFEVESSVSGFPDNFYSTMLTEILAPTGDSFDKWNIIEQFPASSVQFTETLKLFERVIWYTDLVTVSNPHFIAAQIALPEFLEGVPEEGKAGGKIIYTTRFNKTGFTNQGSPLSFSPVEALGDRFDFIFANSLYFADADFYNTFPELQLPELRVSNLFTGAIGLIPKVTTIPMYRYDVSNNDNDPLFIMLGKNERIDNDYNFVFSGTPLHFLNGNNNVDSLFQIIISDIF